MPPTCAPFIKTISVGDDSNKAFIIPHKLGSRSVRQDHDNNAQFVIQKMVPFDDIQTSPNDKTTHQNLYQDYDNSLIAGVCAGLAAYFNISPG